MGVSRFDASAEEQLREIVKRGIASFKIFLAYKGAFGIDDTELYHTLRLAKELGVIVTAHCENETLVAEMQKRLIAEGKTGPEWHEPSRPVRVEAEGVHHLMTFAELTGAHVYIVHTSNSDAIRAAAAARQRGVHVWIETVAPYLVLDETYAEKPNFEGAKYVMSPPLRAKRHQDAIWNALASRMVSTIATDHAPFDFKGQKEMGRDDFTKIPNGIPSIEDRVNLVYTYGVKRGRIDLHTFVDACSTQAAKLFGLFPRKGTIALGSDADLVVYDPELPRQDFSQKTQQMNVDYSAFEGWPTRRPPERRHRPRQSASARRQVRRPNRPRQVADAQADPFLVDDAYDRSRSLLSRRSPSPFRPPDPDQADNRRHRDRIRRSNRSTHGQSELVPQVAVIVSPMYAAGTPGSAIGNGTADIACCTA